MPASDNMKPAIITADRPTHPLVIAVTVFVIVLGITLFLTNRFLKQNSLSNNSDQKTLTPQTTPLGDAKNFIPNLNPNLAKGPLVIKVTTLYTLQGKITKITANGDKYNATLTSTDGTQTYYMSNIGGKGLFRSTSTTEDVQPSSIKPGDDALVDVSITKGADGKETVFVSQITIINH